MFERGGEGSGGITAAYCDPQLPAEGISNCCGFSGILMSVISYWAGSMYVCVCACVCVSVRAHLSACVCVCVCQGTRAQGKSSESGPGL